MDLLAKNLRRAREHRDISQRDASLKTGIGANQIARWERGEGDPHVALVKLLADAYEVPMDHLFMEHPPWFRPPHERRPSV